MLTSLMLPRVHQNKKTVGLSELVPEFDVELVSKAALNQHDTLECNLTYTIIEDMPVRFGISIMDTKSNYPIMNDWVKSDKGTRETVSHKAGRYTYNYKWNVSGINTKELTFIATLYKVDGYRDWETDRKSTRLNSSHITRSRMPSSA